MSEPGRPHGRMTTSSWMRLIAATGVVLAIPALARDPVVARFGLGVGAIVVVFVLTDRCIAWFVGSTCPSCRRRTLRQMARSPRYYRCQVCRGRFFRTGLGRWADASDPSNESRFRSESESRSWQGYESPEVPSDSTSGRLLAKKRAEPVVPGPNRGGTLTQPGRSHLAATLRSISDMVTRSPESP